MGEQGGLGVEGAGWRGVSGRALPALCRGGQGRPPVLGRALAAAAFGWPLALTLPPESQAATRGLGMC